MDEVAVVGTRHTSLTGRVFPQCKSCGNPLGEGGGEPEELHKQTSPDCPGYEPDGPIRELGVLAEG